MPAHPTHVNVVVGGHTCRIKRAAPYSGDAPTQALGAALRAMAASGVLAHAIERSFSRGLRYAIDSRGYVPWSDTGTALAGLRLPAARVMLALSRSSQEVDIPNDQATALDVWAALEAAGYSVAAEPVPTWNTSSMTLLVWGPDVEEYAAQRAMHLRRAEERKAEQAAKAAEARREIAEITDAVGVRLPLYDGQTTVSISVENLAHLLKSVLAFERG